MSSKSATLANDQVETVIRLGWRMAEVYHQPPPPYPHEDELERGLPIHLPGESELGEYEQGKTLVAEIQHDVKLLENAFGFTLQSDAELSSIIEQGVDGDATRQVLLSIHRELRRELATRDTHLATGLDLGRMLADTVLLADPKTHKTITDEFNHFRLGNAYGWLDDLHAFLPTHAADAVIGSLKQWVVWTNSDLCSVVNENAWAQESFTRALHRQGEIWRRLLCGEKLAVDLLSAADYKKAGDRVARSFLNLIGSFIGSKWYVIAIFAATIVGIVSAIVKFVPSGASSTTALITTAAGSLGLSWKTVSSSLGRVIKKAEAPLWDMEVKQAIVIATSHLPHFGEVKA